MEDSSKAAAHPQLMSEEKGKPETTIKPRKIVLSKNRDKGDEDGSTEQDQEKTNLGVGSKRRKWGTTVHAQDVKLPVNISTDSLKELIPDLKTAIDVNGSMSESITELADTPDEVPVNSKESGVAATVKELADGACPRSGGSDEEAVSSASVVTSRASEKHVSPTLLKAEEEVQRASKEKNGRRPLTITRTIMRTPPRADDDDANVLHLDKEERVSENEESNDEPPKKKIVLKKTSAGPPITSLPIDEPEVVRRNQSPPRCAVSRIIHVTNLVRPFTVGQLKELLSKSGILADGDNCFWMDKIKSHCYATYTTEADAEAARKALHGVRWPSSNPKILRVDFATPDEIDFHKERETAKEQGIPLISAAPRAPEPIMRPRQVAEREREAKKKEAAVAAAAVVTAAATAATGPTTSGGDGSQKAKAESTRSPQPVREWDRDKVKLSESPPPQAASRRHNQQAPSDGRDSEPAQSRNRHRSKDRRRRSPERSSRDKERERRHPPNDNVQAKAEPEEAKEPVRLLDDLFRKTKAMPAIYWLPLTEDQIKERDDARAKRNEEREKRRKEQDEKERLEREERRQQADERHQKQQAQQQSSLQPQQQNKARSRSVSRSRSRSKSRRSHSRGRR